MSLILLRNYEVTWGVNVSNNCPAGWISAVITSDSFGTPISMIRYIIFIIFSFNIRIKQVNFLEAI